MRKRPKVTLTLYYSVMNFVSELSYIPNSGPPSGPSGPSGPNGPYKPYPGPHRPNYEASGPSIPDKTYPIEPYTPLNFLPSKPDRFRPDPEIYRPSFQPPEVIIPYKPGYPDPDPEPGYRPGFRPGSEPRPGYRPELPGYGPDRPFRPTVHPKPDPGFQSGFRPGVIPGVDRPGYLPEGRPGQRPQKPVFQVDRDNGPCKLISILII